MANIKKLLISFLFFSCFMLYASCALAADFIVSNSSGEPILIDVSGLNLTSGIDVTIGEFTDQPRSYRDLNTKSIAIFPPAASSSEKTIEVRAGSTVISKTVSFRPAPNGILKKSSLPDLRQGRGGNTSTIISDGRVVLIGGSKGLADNPLSSLEVFSPETGRSEFLMTPNNSKKAMLQIPRSQHTATYLGISNSPLGMIAAPVEQILLVGGFSKDGVLENTLEIVEISVGGNQAVSTLLNTKKSKLKKARIFHTSTLLPDGRVLIVGGQGRINKNSLGALNSIEIFDLVTKTISPSTFLLSNPRLLHTATTLQSGNILIVGGFTNQDSKSFGLGPATDTAELIDTKAFSIKQVGKLSNAVGGHSATLLTNGQVLIIGGNLDLFAGIDQADNSVQGLSASTIQSYDNNNETFNFVVDKSTNGILELQLPRFLHQTLLLPNGDIAVFGGLSIRQGGNTQNFINTPVSEVEVFAPDFVSSVGGILKIEQKDILNTSTGRIQPTAVLVTPSNKTQGFISSSDVSKFVNCAVYLTGGFTNGLGKLPSKVSELIQIESNSGIEGRQIKLTPGAVIQGSYLSEFLVQLDEFNKIPSLYVQPQSINLSNSNNFIATTKVLSTNSEVILLKAQVNDPNSSIIVSPSLFQVGESITLSRKDSSVQGEFDVDIVPVESTSNFIFAKIKVNVSDSSKPFLSTVPAYGISLSTEQGNNSEQVQVKVLSQDGSTVFSSVPNDTQVTATISNPDIANLGGTGVSSVVGNLLTQFNINSIKPGKTNIVFSINFPDIIGVSIPLEISGTPTFSGTPIDSSVLAALASSNGVSLSGVTEKNSSSVSLDDLLLSPNSPLFPIYVPINLLSSIDSSSSVGLFTIRPIFGVDLLTAFPRTFLNNLENDFKSPLSSEPLAIGGITLSNLENGSISVLASDDGIRTVSYSSDDQSPLGSLTMVNGVSGVKDLKLFEGSNGQVKIVAIRGSMLLVIDGGSGETETTADLSGDGFELQLTEINNQNAAIVASGTGGVDLIFPLTESLPRVENSMTTANVKHIAVINKLGNTVGPYVVAYNGSEISIRNLVNVDEAIQRIGPTGTKYSKIAYAGKFLVNNKSTDVLVCTAERTVTLFDLNNLTVIPVSENLKIKNKIEDMVVIDGTAYLALGANGILALSVGGLIDNNKNAEITTFTKNKITIVKSNGRESFVSKPLNANKLANANPFLLSAGENNNLTVIRVSP